MGKSIKSTNTASEVLKRDFSYFGLWRPISIPISNKSRQKYKKILLTNVLLSLNTPKCGTFKLQTTSGYLIFFTTVIAKNRKIRQILEKFAKICISSRILHNTKNGQKPRFFSIFGRKQWNFYFSIILPRFRDHFKYPTFFGEQITENQQL